MSHLGTSPERPQRPSGPGFSTARHDNTHDEKEHKSESCLAVYASRFVISFVCQDIVRTKFFARHPSWLTFWLTATDWVSSGGHLKHRTWANLSCSYLMSWIWSQRVFSPGDGWVFVCSKSVSHCRRLGVRTLDLLHGRDVFVGVCEFSCNLSPALLAEWPGSFTCYCGNTGVERIPKLESAQKVDPGEENSPAAPTGIWTRDLSVTSQAL